MSVEARTVVGHCCIKPARRSLATCATWAIRPDRNQSARAVCTPGPSGGGADPCPCCAHATVPLYAVCLACCLRAYDGSLPFLEIVFVNASAAFLANLTPVPGGMGIQEAALIAGLGAFGVAPDVATAAVVTHRLFTTYLPPIWGSWATKRLLADGYL